MDCSAKVLGTGAATALAQLGSEALLEIGSDRLSREQLASVGCYNFVAARRLSHLLEQLGVKSLKDVFEHVPPRDLALPHLGVISLAVLGAAFEVKKIGGEAPLEAYVRRHSPKVVTFHSIKAQVKRIEEAAVKTRRKRRRVA